MDASDLEKGVSDDSSEGGEAVGEVDPDSNDEGFYANDYPDEEDFSDGFSERISSDADSSDGDGSGWER